jgi:hypothetical protein
MARRRNTMGKRRTREHVIADLSVNHIERHVLLAGHTVEKRFHDYGLDLILSTYDREGFVEAGVVFLQVKATDSLETRQRGRYISCKIEHAHLRVWLAEPMPVILAVYDAHGDCAYWLYVQAALGGRRRGRSESVTVRVPTDQVFDTAAVQEIRGFRDRIEEQSRKLFHHE